jgi:acetyltransferase
MTNDPRLSLFFKPRGVALVGVSQDPSRLGYGLARKLIQSDYKGSVHLVNPKGGALLHHRVYTDIASVPDPVDLAVLLVPAALTASALEACGKRGIHAVIISSGGFRETGPEGAAYEAECLRVASQYQIRVIGPNCIGVIDTHLPLDTCFAQLPISFPGDIALVSHSGAICAALIDWSSGQGFGFSRLVSLGNQADVNETDILAAIADDPDTRVVTMYLEAISNGRRFVEQGSRVAQEKPVVVYKVGRNVSGQRAAASHTGALACPEYAFQAALRRSGIIQAETMEQMYDWARALASCPLPKGRSVAVLTNAGGPGVIAADHVEINGLHLAKLGDQTMAALKALLPAAASVHNPVDMLASATPEHYVACLRILLEDPGVNSVLVIIPPLPMFPHASVATAVIPFILTSEKPVVVAVLGERLIGEAVERLRIEHIPEYRCPERAVSALAALSQRAESLEKLNAKPVDKKDIHPEKVRSILRDVIPDITGLLPQRAVGEILAAYGISTLSMELATNADEAMKLAHKLGFPVALKIASPEITHKSDVGGVILDLKDEGAVVAGFKDILQNVQQALPASQISGVYVQRMAPKGQEIILGAVQDSIFGALVMFGAGGTEVEGLGDTAFALAPLTLEDAEYVLKTTWAGRKLKGFRNLPPADREAVLDALIRLAQLAADFPQLNEIEVNPLEVLSEGRGVVAVDYRARLSLNSAP